MQTITTQLTTITVATVEGITTIFTPMKITLESLHMF